MATPTDMRQHAQELLEHLPGSSLPQVVEFLENLQHDINPPQQPTTESSQEKVLISIIQRRLPPDVQTRLAYLRQQNESGTITESEHQELLKYIEQVEQQDAERAEALIKLAQLRDVPLTKLINEYLPIPSV
jgi:hypothetical protein